MNTVYILDHVMREFEDDEDVKMIGVYSTEEKARDAIVRLSAQPGFRENAEGFRIGSCELDKDHWEEGFVTVVHDAED